MSTNLLTVIGAACAGAVGALARYLVETFNLLQSGSYLLGSANIFGSIAIGMIAVYGGTAVGRWI